MEEDRPKAFEKRALKKIFGPKRNKVMREWRNLHTGELYNLYSSPEIIRQRESRRMSWVERVARRGEGRNFTRFWWESRKERDYSEDRGIDGMIGLNGTFAGRVRSGFTRLRIGIEGGLL
jgi:hypothetical protein